MGCQTDTRVLIVISRQTNIAKAPLVEFCVSVPRSCVFGMWHGLIEQQPISVGECLCCPRICAAWLRATMLEMLPCALILTR